MVLRSSRKTERHRVANSRAFFKRNLSAYKSPFHSAARKGYKDKSIEHPHLYACEGASRHSHSLCFSSHVDAILGT